MSKDEVGSNGKPILRTMTKTPVRQTVTRLADGQDRIQILREVFPHVSPGSMRISDVPEVLAAQVDKCILPIKEWEVRVQTHATGERCRGLFFASFGRKHLFRQCDVMCTGDFCKLCAKMLESAKTDSERVLRVRNVPEYEVVNQAFTTRKSVVECAKFWEEESTRMRKSPNDKFPHFTVKEIINLVMLEGRVVASK